MRLDLAPSVPLAALIVAAHLVAAACVRVVMPGAAGWLLAAALLALGLAAAWSRALLRAGRSVRALEIGGEEVRLDLAGGDSFAAAVDPRRYVSRLFVTLRVLRPVRRNVLVTADMLPADAFRRLRIWALWGKLPVAGKQLPQ